MRKKRVEDLRSGKKSDLVNEMGRWLERIGRDRRRKLGVGGGNSVSGKEERKVEEGTVSGREHKHAVV